MQALLAQVQSHILASVVRHFDIFGAKVIICHLSNIDRLRVVDIHTSSLVLVDFSCLEKKEGSTLRVIYRDDQPIV